MKLFDIKIREDISNEEVFERICKKYKLNISKINNWTINKKSVDARNKEDVYYNYIISISFKDEKEISLKPKTYNIKLENRPVVIGAGPAGLFSAYTLAQNGLNPILIEQGKSVDERIDDVNEFRKNGKLNTLSNVQFGEGGAGTFSDGKLTTNVNNGYCKIVLETFYKFGAPQQILYESKPHIGTDNLVSIVKNMREEIIKLGGEVLFNSKLIDFTVDEGKINSILVENTISKETQIIKTDNIILAIGHSARDTFEKLYEKNVNMQRKNFSVGVRIEHDQKMINESQYGIKTKLKLPPADYKLAYHGEDRSCYTFCMCPGGEVIASSSEEGVIVTNGMSKFKRDGENANSAVLVNVVPSDFEGDSPLAGIYFQKNLEKKAFELGGSNYYAPIQRVEDFINNVPSDHIGKIKPTYMPGVKLSNLNEILPKFVAKTLKDGIKYFDTKIKGFANPDAILTGVETRSSSPVTIVRDENFLSNVKGIYPCGEGAGYAGGITTSAIDGIKCAIKLMENNEI